MNNDNYLATIYDEDSRPVTTYPDELARYLKRRFIIPDGARLADVGCGRGDFLKAFIRAGFNAVGIDGEKVDGDPCIIGDINLEQDRLPFEDDSLDVVFTKSVIEHIHNPDSMMKECHRVLKPRGRIIVMVPDWQTCMYIYYDDHTHVQPYTATGLRDLLRMYGFGEVSSEQFYQLPIVWRHPAVKIISKGLQLLGPVKKVNRNKFYRFSRELMLLGTGLK